MLKRVSILFLILFFSNVLFAEEINNRIFYKVFSSDYQALQSSSITKSNDGFIWIVNGYGVSRYDGKHFKNYFIKNDWRGFIKKNNSGELYVCTYSGVGYQYNHFTDTFDEIFNIFASNQIPGSPLKTKRKTNSQISITEKDKENSVRSMEIDQFGRIWLSTSAAILCYNPQNKTWLNLNTGMFNTTFLLLANNRLYLFGKEKICFIRLSERLQKQEQLHTLLNLNTNNEISSAYFDKQTANVYYGIYNNGLFCLNTKNENIKLLEVKNSPIRSIKMYGHNLLLVGIDGLGLYEYNIDSKLVEAKQSENVNHPDALGSNGIFDIYVDDNNRIWVATNSKGVNVYDPGLLYFRRFSHLLNVENSLVHDYVHAIYEDKNRNLWFGTNDGVSVWNKWTGQWKHFLNNKSIADHNTGVFSFCEDKKENVWVGVYGYKLVSVNATSYSVKTSETIYSSKQSLNNSQYKLNYDANSIWGGGNENNFFKFNPETRKVSYFNISNIKSIEKDDNSNLWILTGSQIVLFNKATGKQNIELQKKIANYLNKSHIEFSCMKRDGNDLWIGTSNLGIIRCSFSTNSIDYFSTKDGLPSNNILAIEIDNNNCLWFSTDIGLCYFNPVTKSTVQFKTLDLPEKNVFNPMVSYKCTDGTLVFGTKQGVVSFRPGGFLFSASRGPLAWTELSIYNQNKRDLNKILDNELNNTNKIILHHDENSFKIGFQELNFNQSIYTRYTHCLKKFEKNFSDMSIENNVSYYNLSPGTYQLVVRSYFANKDGKYIEREIEIIIRQPWWNTVWAWFIWISILAVISVSFYRFNKNRLDRKYSEEKTRFFINVSHDMRTPITLIKAPLSDLLNDKSLSPTSKYLVNTISRNVNRLFDMINRILDFEKSDEAQMRLFPETHELNDFVKEIAENFYSYANIKGLTLDYQTLNQSVWVVFDRTKMEMVVENLVSNAVKYTENGGIVKLIAGCDSRNWWIEVEDNGIGIPQSEQKKIFKRFFRAENAINSKQIGSGMGLLLVNNLTKFMGGSVMFESKEGIKTVFRITFPLLDTSTFTRAEIQPNTEIKQELLSENTKIPTLLFVDDNDEIRTYIANRLTANYNILTAQSAAEALNILNKNNVSILISDIMMPDVSGIQLCETIKADNRYSHIPVILLSALSDKKDIMKGLQIGADDYITKPFESDFLIQRVDNILANRKRLAQFFEIHKGQLSQLSKQNFINELDRLFIEKLEHIFDANISNPEYTIELLCRDFGISRTVFFNRLKNLMNVSPNEYMRVRRLDKAAELLLTKKYSVTEVAELVGYNDVKYFSTQFSKKFGCWPSRYEG